MANGTARANGSLPRMGIGRFGHDFSQVRVYPDEKAAASASAVNAVKGSSPFSGRSPRVRKEIPLPLGFDVQEGGTSPWLDETVANLDQGRSLPLHIRDRLSDAPPWLLDQIRIHDDPHSRTTADLLNAQAVAYKKHIVLGNRGRDADWLTAMSLPMFCSKSPQRRPGERETGYRSSKQTDSLMPW
jgi:hypothetical protein